MVPGNKETSNRPAHREEQQNPLDYGIIHN